ncbi:MAG TPA: flagellar hook-length control protein FliK [Accumulibacter sp.]|uniref:flagellar hook-length control protein FliK n=1 Tax=Accumulibacter sp. TaxID=2053492 RepID=UPI002CD2949B|nr:flagellar hook-length control protein FliK [Accumulibacter sp.]HRD92003.1 flagellar hook-length control protein FliK [Accumulibacter sp.]HRF72241.1 flagellar hook-length control protein FliK [Accumulibacter sp.]
MSIAIVSSFPRPRLPDASPENVAARPVAADAASSGAGFASLLLGLQVKANEAPPDKDAAADRKTAFGEAGPEVSDAPFLTVLDPTQRTLASPSTFPERPLAGEPDLPGLSVTTVRNEPIVVPGNLALPTDPLNLKTRTADERGSSTAQSLDAASKAANIGHEAAKVAVAEVARRGFERPEAMTPEPVSPASSLATLATAPHAQQPVATAPVDGPQSLQTPLRDPSWAGDFGQKLLWFASHDKQLAQLTLNPPQLGSLEITLRIDKDSANAHFASANADVRGAIETALPRLREMFASAGIDLGQVSVGSESFRQPGEGRNQPDRPPLQVVDGTILANDFASGLLAQTIATQHGSALIDIYA